MLRSCFDFISALFQLPRPAISLLRHSRAPPFAAMASPRSLCGEVDVRAERRWAHATGFGQVREFDFPRYVSCPIEDFFLDLNTVHFRLVEPASTSVQSLADDLERVSPQSLGSILLRHTYWPKMLQAVLTELHARGKKRKQQENTEARKKRKQQEEPAAVLTELEAEAEAEAESSSKSESYGDFLESYNVSSEIETEAEASLSVPPVPKASAASSSSSISLK